MSIGIKPLGARVVIKKMEAEEKTEAGLLLSGSAKEKPQQAEVLAVGPGTEEEPMQLKVGDIVIFSNHIAIVSDRRNKDGVCLILHHANPFQLSFEEDGLSWYGQIRGHFRLIPPEIR